MNKQTMRTWYSGGIGSAGITVEHDDLKGLSLPKQFCNSMILLHKNVQGNHSEIDTMISVTADKIFVGFVI